MIEEESNLMWTYEAMSPQDLRSVADQMEEEGVVSIEISQIYYNDIQILQCRMESPKEFEKRYNKEYNSWKAWKEKEKQRKEGRKEELIKEAKKLGLKVSE